MSTHPDNVRQLIKSIHIFSGLDDAVINEILEFLQRETYRQNSVIFESGDAGDAAFIIHSGRVRIYLRTEDGKQVTFATLSRGDLFGERSIIRGEPRSASAMAITDDVVLYRISQDSFEGLLAAHPRLQNYFFKAIDETATTNYLRVTVLDFFKRRFGMLLAAVVVFISVVTFFPFRYLKKPETVRTVATEETAPAVHAIRVVPQTLTVTWTGFGVVQEDDLITLTARTPGRVAKAGIHDPGESFTPDTVLFAIDAKSMELQLASLQAQFDETPLRAAMLKIDRDALEIDLQDALALEILANKTVSKETELRELRDREFRRHQALWQSGNLTEAEMTQTETLLKQTELAVMRAETSLKNAERSCRRIRADLERIDIECQRVPMAGKQILSRIESLKLDLADTTVKAGFSGRVVEVLVDEGQEVAAGAVLATVRPAASVHLRLMLPNSQFRWLHQGGLLHETDKTRPAYSSLEITYESTDFVKVFTGAYIRSVGERLETPTGSLPIIIGRDNPLGDGGEIIAAEELIPGMYCSVTLPLCELQDVYVIPRESVQNDGSVCQLSAGGDGDTRTLRIWRSYSVVHEIAEGLVIHADNPDAALHLVPHPIRNVRDGMAVRVVLPTQGSNRHTIVHDGTMTTENATAH